MWTAPKGAQPTPVILVPDWQMQETDAIARLKRVG